MFTNSNTRSIVYSAVHSRAVRIPALLLLSGLLSYAQRVVGYYEGSTTFPLSNLVTNGSLQRLTHINYAFAAINQTATGYTCALASSELENGPTGYFQELKALKAQNPGLSVLISVGGALGSGNFSAAASPANLDAFAQSCVDTFIDGQFSSPKSTGIFDGIDIDWEFPKTPNDVGNYTALMKSLHTKLNTYGLKHPGLQRRLWLTSAISPNNGPDWQLQNIDFSSTGATQYVDFFNVMAYDNAGTWNSAPGSTAALSWIEAVMPNLMSQGIPAGKIVLGIPFYGIHYDGSKAGNFAGDTTNTGLSTLISHSPVAPVQTPGPPPGTLDTSYDSILTQTLLQPTGAPNVNVSVQHDGDGTAWAFDSANSLLWAYDDATTIHQKGVWANSQKFAGVMTWQIGQDNSAGTLLCALEATVSLPNSVCRSSTPPALFDFEGGVSGWMTTGSVNSIAGSTAYAYTGNVSMAVTINSTLPLSPGTVWIVPPATVKPGETVSFKVYVPDSSLANLSDIQPFFMDANWHWTGTFVSAGNLTPNAWNTVSVMVPLTASAPFQEIGLQFDSKTSWTGTIYVDTVTLH